MASLPIIYYSIERGKQGEFIVKFWTKAGNTLKFSSTSIDQDKIRKRIEQITGKKKFNLELIV